MFLVNFIDKNKIFSEINKNQNDVHGHVVVNFNDVIRMTHCA